MRVDVLAKQCASRHATRTSARLTRSVPAIAHRLNTAVASASCASTATPSTATPVHTNDTPTRKWDERVLSGIQPTGIPHLGNYCGAIAKWVDLQQPASTVQRLYSVVDLHAITVPFDPTQMPTQIRSMVAALLGAGLDPQQNILFKQSDVRCHTELAWYLGCITPLGWLERMTQFKQKAAAGDHAKRESSLGLLAYPVLMAADILVYRATHVPVGDDQQQHLELARMIATTFNDRFHADVFPKPFPVLSEAEPSNPNPNQMRLARIMSLRDPLKKMSKSDAAGGTRSRIELTDTPDLIHKKIMKATTDAIPGITFDKQQRPGVANLLAIFSAVTHKSVDALAHEFATAQTGVFKQNVADAVIAKICPIGDRIQQYQADPAFIDRVLADGALRASEIAETTMHDVKRAMGL